MKNIPVLLILLFLSCKSFTQKNGQIISKEPFLISDSVKRVVESFELGLVKKVTDSVDFYRITYLSDGLKVKAIMAEPKYGKKYPCIISNRGGNREFGKWNPFMSVIILGRYASWGYVVVGSQYRGNDGGEGKEEFGGKDVNDVLNLFPVLAQLPKADTSRIAIEGASRGGMMTYLALKKTCRFKAAIVTAGAADLFADTLGRPEMEKYVYAELIPDYWKQKKKVLKERSAVYWAKDMCKTTPLLIQHGSADWRVKPTESITLVQKLYESKHPVRFILYEGADHMLTEYLKEGFGETKRHLDYYVRDGKKWPSMEPHGR